MIPGGRSAASSAKRQNSSGGYLIAAAVQTLDARLLTLNVRHFPMIPGLLPAYT